LAAALAADSELKRRFDVDLRVGATFQYVQ